MILKLFKVIWFFSLLAVSGVLFYVYASLPEVVRFEEGDGDMALPREAFFYIMLSVMAVFNLFVFVLPRLFTIAAPWNIVTWFYGLAILFNLFFVVTLSFTSLINSGERFDFSSIGVIIYGSLVLLAGWTLVWPVYLAVRRMRA
jgi:hypothetical protein